mgnify:CR=1 FL=1
MSIKGFFVKFSAFNLQPFWLACLLLGLTACGSVTNSDKINYKTESSAKPVPLDIPPDLTQLSRDTRFSLPGGTVTASSMGTKSTAAVPTAAKQINDARIERDGQQRWIVIKRPPEEIWPIVHSFWIDNGFTYTLDQQELGILETEWAENRAKLPQDFMRKYLGKVINSGVTSGMPHHDATIPMYKFDKAKAIALLKEAKFDFSKTVRLRTYNQTQPAVMILLTAVAQQLTDLGMKVEFLPFQGDATTELWTNRNYEIALKGLSAFNVGEWYAEYSNPATFGKLIGAQPQFEALNTKLLQTTGVRDTDQVLKDLQKLEQANLYKLPTPIPS